jgi:O-acetyl-ADP-ribose deacetylase (regulator of RNase III)
MKGIAGLPYKWRVGPVSFHFADADLFDVPVQSIVNSEQSDFVLSTNPATISGQLYHRFGGALQDELDRQTQGRTLAAGTVLKTGGGSRYQYIFHAGFHRPDEWLDSEDRETQETDSVQVIRRCVRSVLDEMANGVVHSVGFPLIGTGIYEIDASLLVYEFSREVVDHAQRGGLPREVWLAVRGDQAADLVEPLVQGLVDGLYGEAAIAQWELGVSFLDRFSRCQVHSGDPRFRAWMLTRYAELLVEYMFFHLAVASQPPLGVEKALLPGRGLSFGFVRQEAQNLALRAAGGVSGGWCGFLADRLRADMQIAHVVLRITEDRNNLAHGRVARDPGAIESDLKSFVRPTEWEAVRQRYGDPGESDLGPWVHVAPDSGHGKSTESRFGVLERWTRKHYEYLVPDTGQTFCIPRSEGAP